VRLLCVASTSLHLHYVNLVGFYLSFHFEGFPLPMSFFYIFSLSTFSVFLHFWGFLFYYFNFFIFFFHLRVLLFMFAYFLMHYVSNLDCPIYLTIFSKHLEFFVISLSHFLSPLKLLTLFLLFVSLFVHSYLFIYSNSLFYLLSS
jgi:hypothetical protein